MKKLFLPLLCFFLLSYVSSATVIEVPEAVGGMLIGSGAVGGGGDGEPGFRNYSTAVDGTSGIYSLTIDVPSGTQDGDIMVVALASGNDDTFSCTGWTTIHDMAPGSACGMSVLYKVASSEPENYEFSCAGSCGLSEVGIMISFSKTDGTWDPDQDAGEVDCGVASICTTPTGVDTTDNSVFISAFINDDDEEVDAEPGTADDCYHIYYNSSTPPSLVMCYEFTDSGSDKQHTLDWSGSDDQVGAISAVMDLVP